MNPIWLATLVLSALVWLTWEDTRARPVALNLNAGEQNLALKIVQPEVRQFDENGQLSSVMVAPEALDFGGTQPGEISRPTMQWPQSGWQATADVGLIFQGRTDLQGNVRATNGLNQNKLQAPLMQYDGTTLLAIGKRDDPATLTTPDLRGSAQTVAINDQLKRIELTSTVETTLWPAR